MVGQPTSNGTQRQPVPSWVSALLPLLTLAIGAGIAWGVSQQTTSDLTRRMDLIESTRPALVARLEATTLQNVAIASDLAAIKGLLAELKIDFREHLKERGR
jgi:hypothetical protein